jgi:hypothetical protein
MNLHIKFATLFKFVLIVCFFTSNTAGAQPRPPCRGDSVSSAKIDCYSAVKPFDIPSPRGHQDDVFHFCTYGDKKANVFVVPPDKNTGAKARPTYCPAVCSKIMTTYDKEIEGDANISLPKDLVRRPNPTAPDALTCNPAGIALLGAAACIPKFCPCTNFAIQALWTAVCSNRETGVWGK